MSKHTSSDESGMGGGLPPQPQDADRRVNEVLELSKSKTSDSGPIVHILWLVEGLDLYHRTGGKMGHSLDDCKRYIASQIIRGFILKADVVEAMGDMEGRETEDMSLKSWTPEDYKAFGRNHLRAQISESLNLEGQDNE